MKTKQRLILVVVVALFIIRQSYAQNLQWIKQAGGLGGDYYSGICTDYSGDYYAIGQYIFIPTQVAASSISFDSITLLPNGDNQLFVVKYSALGNVLWAKSIGGNNIIGTSNLYERATSICYDSFNQCIYITGNIYGTAVFGSTILSGYGVSFYCKMDLSGNFIWAKQFPYSSSSSIAISCDNQGHQILYGGTSDSLYIGSNLLLPGGFLARFNINNGAFTWSHSNVINGRKKFANGNIYATQNLYNDSLKIDTALFVSSTNHNILLVCMDSLGKLKWYRAAKSTIDAYVSDVEIDFDGNAYIAGSFGGNLDFGSSTITNGNNYDLFISKYDSLGNLIWVKQGNASNGAGISELSIAQNGSLLAAGVVDGNVSLDAITISTTMNLESFAIKCNQNSGQCLSSHLLGTGKPKFYNFDNYNNLYVSGDFYQSMFIGNNVLTSVGYDDIFTAKYNFSTDIRENFTKNKNNQLLIHANPTAGKCNITIPDDFIKEKNLVLSIYSSNGQLIQQQNLNMEEGVIKLNLEAEAKGLYNAVLTNGSKSYSGKIVFE